MPKNTYACDCHALNEELVAQTKNVLPEHATIKTLCEFFGILGDYTRCKILLALKEAPLCVCDLSNVLSMTKSAISHQLNAMKKAGVVKCCRSGKQVVYSLDDNHVAEFLSIGLMHAKEKVYEK